MDDQGRTKPNDRIVAYSDSDSDSDASSDEKEDGINQREQTNTPTSPENTGPDYLPEMDKSNLPESVHSSTSDRGIEEPITFQIPSRPVQSATESTTTVADVHDEMNDNRISTCHSQIIEDSRPVLEPADLLAEELGPIFCRRDDDDSSSLVVEWASIPKKVIAEYAINEHDELELIRNVISGRNPTVQHSNRRRPARRSPQSKLRDKIGIKLLNKLANRFLSEFKYLFFLIIKKFIA